MLKHLSLALILALFALPVANPASAQLLNDIPDPEELEEDNAPRDPFGTRQEDVQVADLFAFLFYGPTVEVGVDAKVVFNGFGANAEFDRFAGATDAANPDLGDTIFGAGLDGRFAAPINDNTRVFAGAWNMFGGSDANSLMVFAPGDSTEIRIHGFTPNQFTFYAGAEVVVPNPVVDNLLNGLPTQTTIGAYGGVRQSEVEFTHRAQGPVNQFAEERRTETILSGLAGLEATVRTAPQNGQPFYFFVRGGAQLDFGGQFSSTVTTPGAVSRVEFNTGPSIHGYAMFGIGVALGPQPRTP